MSKNKAMTSAHGGSPGKSMQLKQDGDVSIFDCNKIVFVVGWRG